MTFKSVDVVTVLQNERDLNCHQMTIEDAHLGQVGQHCSSMPLSSCIKQESTFNLAEIFEIKCKWNNNGKANSKGC